MQEAGVQLRQGDVIKLGRIRFKIKEIHKGIFQLKNNYNEEEVNFVFNDARVSAKDQMSKPQINNYIKQSRLIKKSQSATAK